VKNPFLRMLENDGIVIISRKRSGRRKRTAFDIFNYYIRERKNTPWMPI
jgi:hypothetical protein